MLLGTYSNQRIKQTDNWIDFRATRGQTFVYEYQAGTWQLKGQVLSDDQDGSYFGASVALSADGNLLAVGAPSDVDSGDGHLHVFQYEEGRWVRVAKDPEQQAKPEEIGTAVALSDDSRTVALSKPQDEYGAVRVYQQMDTGWTQLGQTLRRGSLLSGMLFGASVSLSADGHTLAVGMRRAWQGSQESAAASADQRVLIVP